DRAGTAPGGASRAARCLRTHRAWRAARRGRSRSTARNGSQDRRTRRIFRAHRVRPMTSSRGAVQRKLETAASLGKLVTTMKGLASVRVHQYRRTMRALDASTLTLDLAARALLYLHPELAESQPRAAASSITVVFGSDRGLCGAFNDRMARFAAQDIAESADEDAFVRVVAVGRRVARRLRRAGRLPDVLLATPSSLDAVDVAVAELLDFVDAQRRPGHDSRLRLVYARPLGSTRFEPRSEQVLPVDSGWVRRL